MGRGKSQRTTKKRRPADDWKILETLLGSLADARPPRNKPAAESFGSATHTPEDPSYETSPVNRLRRTKAAIDAIQTAIYNTLAADHPQTVRGVFYRLEVAGLVPKDMAGYGVVQRECLKLRRNGVVPYAWITDGTRLQRKPNSYDDLGDFYFRTAQLYRRNLWAGANVSVEIWCEKDALAGVLLEETAIWDVPLMVARGFSSESFLHATAEQIKDDGRPTYIYHFGDHDPSGLLVDAQIARGLQRLAPDADIRFRRLAVTPAQISDWELPTRPTKRENNRHAHGFSGRSVELDAIPAYRLRQLVRDAISQHIDAAALQTVQTAEASEMQILRRMAKRELGKTYDPSDAITLTAHIARSQDQLKQRWATISETDGAP